VGKSNQLYNELLEKQINPEMIGEKDEQLSIEDLSQITEKLEEVIDQCTEKIENSSDVNERKKNVERSEG
jgi:hypothetical protein